MFELSIVDAQYSQMIQNPFWHILREQVISHTTSSMKLNSRFWIVCEIDNEHKIIFYIKQTLIMHFSTSERDKVIFIQKMCETIVICKKKWVNKQSYLWSCEGVPIEVHDDQAQLCKDYYLIKILWCRLCV